MRKSLKVFRYLDEIDAFLPTEEYLEVARLLGFEEWNPVVWIGRLFTLDNDFGEHWFDNWDLREERHEAAEELGLDAAELLILDPDRFQDGRDGPCHPPAIRKRFWTDVLRTLELSYELLIDVARRRHARRREVCSADVLREDGLPPDLDDRVATVRSFMDGRLSLEEVRQFPKEHQDSGTG